jgi:hypothetical protein
MWLFLTARLRQWVILAIVIPLATALVRRIRRRLEARSGPTKVTKVLGAVEGLGGKPRARRAKR